MTKGLKQRVEHILKHFPYTRDNDTKLILRLYEEYYFLSQTLTAHKLFEIMEYDAPDDIVRFRRHIQNKEYKYLPTTEEIMRKRRMNIDKCREVLGYAPQKQDTL